MALLSACGGSEAATDGALGSSPVAPSSTGASTASDSLPPKQDIVAAGATRADVPGEPDWLVLAGGSAWSATGGVTQLDGRTGRVLGTIKTKSPVCIGMDVGFGSVWAYTCDTPTILRIDPDTAQVQTSVALPAGMKLNEESALSAGQGAVWGVLADQKSLLRVDATSGEISRTFPVPAGATSIRAGLGALWVTNYAADTLMRLDPKSADVVASIPVGSGPRFLAIGRGAVWVLNQADGTVSRVDSATNTVTATVRVDTGPIDGGDIAFGGGAVWARVSDGLVSRIDPKTSNVVARYGPSSGSGGVAADSTATWIAAHDVNAVWRLPRG